MDKKIFTIIIPVYNAEKTIQRALASLISNKEFIKEVIIINDRCTDKTIEKISVFEQFYPITILNNNGNKGPGPARKLGIENTTSEWLTFLDADDCLIPSCLYYVYNEIMDSPKIKLLCGKTIYYESGSFTETNIEYLDYSCGGNYYNKKFLIENEFYPHPDLYMSEDEYFNNLIFLTIRRVLKKENYIKYYDYPLYEVHHDYNEYTSFAHSKWCDYICKYHMLSTIYSSDYFIKRNQGEEVKDQMIDAIFFCYGCYKLYQNEEGFNGEEYDKVIKKGINFFLTSFKENKNTLQKYRYNKDFIKNVCTTIFLSTGISVEPTLLKDFGTYLHNV